MMQGKLWYELYRPKSLADMVISEEKKTTITEWFVKFKKGEADEYALLFTGPPGLGKTSLAHVILKEFGFQVKEFNASDIRSKSLINENLSGLININNVQSKLVHSNNIKTTGIIMDEVDGMFKGDRGGVDELLSFISVPSNRKKKVSQNNNRSIPIICICNIGSIKKETINSLKKECFTIEFNLPQKRDLMKLLERVATAENMKLTIDAKNSILEYAQGDFRRLVSILEFINVYHGNITIDESNLYECYDLMCRKERDLYVTDAIRNLINNKLEPFQIQSIYNSDKSKTPMVIHQNYIHAISAQKTTISDKIESSLQIINNLIISDVIEKAMYNTQNWNLQSIQSFTCAHVPNYYINRMPKKAHVEARWASVLSINSQAQNLRKNLYQELHKMSETQTYCISDLQQMVEVVFYNLINGHTLKALDILLRYKLCDNAEFKKKKALMVIDKIAKYIKISPYYDKWTKFRNDNKTNKSLDSEIKNYMQSFQQNPVKMTISKPDKIQKPEVQRQKINVKTVEQQKSLAKVRKTIAIKLKPKC